MLHYLPVKLRLLQRVCYIITSSSTYMVTRTLSQLMITPIQNASKHEYNYHLIISNKAHQLMKNTHVLQTLYSNTMILNTAYQSRQNPLEDEVALTKPSFISSLLNTHQIQISVFTQMYNLAALSKITRQCMSHYTKYS